MKMTITQKVFYRLFSFLNKLLMKSVFCSFLFLFIVFAKYTNHDRILKNWGQNVDVCFFYFKATNFLWHGRSMYYFFFLIVLLMRSFDCLHMQMCGWLFFFLSFFLLFFKNKFYISYRAVSSLWTITRQSAVTWGCGTRLWWGFTSLFHRHNKSCKRLQHKI